MWKGKDYLEKVNKEIYKNHFSHRNPGIHESSESHKSESSDFCDPHDIWSLIPILAMYSFVGSVLSMLCY